MSDEQFYAGSVIEPLGGNILASNSMTNLIECIVHSQHVGLDHSTVRIRAGRRIDIRIRPPIDDDRCFFPGQQVIAMIPAEVVRLEAGLFRRSRQRLNRWYGRIVLVTPHHEGRVLTANVHGERWSLISTMPIVGSAQQPQTSDSVNIVVDPQAIELVTGREAAPLSSKIRRHAGFVAVANPSY